MTPLGTEVVLGPGHIVLDGDQAAPAKRVQQPPPLFGPCPFWPWSLISGTAELLFSQGDGGTFASAPALAACHCRLSLVDGCSETEMLLPSTVRQPRPSTSVSDSLTCLLLLLPHLLTLSTHPSHHPYPSLFHSRLKTYLYHKSFPPQTFFRH